MTAGQREEHKVSLDNLQRIANQPAFDTGAQQDTASVSAYAIDAFAPATWSRMQPDPAVCPEAENLLSLLKVKVDAFAVCEIGQGFALNVPPCEDIVVHFVLTGSGAVEWEGGRVPLEPGTIAIIPRGLAKRLTGPGIVKTVVEANDTCDMRDGMMQFEVHDGPGTGLRLACASVSADLAHGVGLFDYLREPLVEGSSRRSTAMFEVIFEEVSRPLLGTKSLIEASMKQILLLCLRRVLADSDVCSPIYLAMMDYRLARVVNEIVSKPGERHALSDLACMAGTTTVGLVKKFRSLFGHTPFEFVLRVRVDAAKIMLVSTKSPVKCIAGSVGFASRSHFSREFSRITGQDPTSFRKLCWIEAVPSDSHETAAILRHA